MRMPGSIKMLMIAGRSMCVAGLAVMFVVRHYQPRSDGPMIVCLEAELAGAGMVWSAFAMFMDYQRDQEHMRRSAGFAPSTQKPARESRAARESSNGDQIDVTHDSMEA